MLVAVAALLNAAIPVAAPAQLTAPLSPQEIERRFSAFDTNHDGLIDPTEFQLNKVTVLFEPRGRSASGAIDRQVEITRAESRLSPAAFDAMDTNSDGVLTGGEIIGADQLQFERIDRNGDGFIDREEFELLARSLFR
jgi:Ca2+-binding EF-hand superfamily protein